MSKEDVINYVMTTPSNPNKAVLEGMLDSFSDGEGGSGSSRVLLYENDALDISQSGALPINYASLQVPCIPPYGITTDTYTVEIDGEVAVMGEFTKNSNDYYLGLTSPGDTAGLANYSAGVKAMTTGGIGSDSIVVGVNQIYIDSSKFTTSPHSVKIYREA